MHFGGILGSAFNHDIVIEEYRQQTSNEDVQEISRKAPGIRADGLYNNNNNKNNNYYYYYYYYCCMNDTASELGGWGRGLNIRKLRS